MIFEKKRIQKLLKETQKRINQLKSQVVDSHLATIYFFSFHTNIVFLVNDRQLNFTIKVYIVKNVRKVSLMIDIKVFVIEFVSFNFVKHHKLLIITLSKSMKLRLANNETTYQITRMTQVKIQLKNHLEKL